MRYERAVRAFGFCLVIVAAVGCEPENGSSGRSRDAGADKGGVGGSGGGAPSNDGGSAGSGGSGTPAGCSNNLAPARTTTAKVVSDLVVDYELSGQPAEKHYDVLFLMFDGSAVGPNTPNMSVRRNSAGAPGGYFEGRSATQVTWGGCLGRRERGDSG